MPDASRAAYSALLIPNPRITLALTSGSSAGAHVGQPVPVSGTDEGALDLRTLRVARDGTEPDLTITVSEPGLPARTSVEASAAAAFVVERENVEYGWSPPFVLTGWRALQMTDGSTGTVNHARRPQLAVTPAGTAVAIWEQDTGTSRRVVVSRLARGASDWTAAALIVTGLDPNRAVHPCLVALASGRLIAYYWYTFADASGVEWITIRARYSDDDGDTWDGLSASNDTAVIRTPWKRSGTGDTYQPGPLRAAAAPDGRVLLLAGLVSDTFTEAVTLTAQLASNDAGCSFVVVSEPEDNDDNRTGDATCAFVDSAFVVAAFTDLACIVTRIGDPYTPLRVGAYGSGTALAALENCRTWDNTGKTITSPGLALVVADDGVLWLYSCSTSTTSTGVVGVSYDGGVTWGEERTWYSWGDDTGPTSIAAVAHEGRVLLLHERDAEQTPGTTYANSIAVAYLGGWSNKPAPYPSDVLFPGAGRQVHWPSTWVPFDEPGDVGWATSGAAADVEELDLDSGAWRLAMTSAGPITRRWQIVSGGAVQTMRVEFHAVTPSTRTGQPPGSQPVQAKVRATDGSTWTGEVQITMDADHLYVFKVDSAILVTLVATVDIDPPTRADGELFPVAVRVVIIPATSSASLKPLARVWWRYATDSALHEWTEAAEIELENIVAVSTTAMVSWGANMAVSGHQVFWHGVWYDTNNDGRGLKDYTSTLTGRPFSSRGTYITDGVTLLAQGGPVTGDLSSWTIATAYDYDLQRLLETDPRRGWRSTDNAEQVIELAWGSVDEPISDVLALAFIETNIGRVKVSFYDTATTSWTAEQTVLLTVGPVDFARTGTCLSPASGNRDPLLVRHGEFDGAIWSDNGVAEVAAIERTTSGRWTASGTTQRARLYLSSATAGDIGASGNGGRVIPRRAVLLLSLQGETYTKARIRITDPDSDASQPPPLGGYWRIGSLVAGELLLLADEPDWGRVVETVAQRQTVQYPGAPPIHQPTGPAVRRVDLALTDGVDQGGAELDDDDPNWHALDPDGEPIALSRCTPAQLEGAFAELAERSRGPMVVYLPRVEAFTGGATSQVVNRRHKLVYGHLETESHRSETALGDEAVDEVVRVATFTVRELR